MPRGMGGEGRGRGGRGGATGREWWGHGGRGGAQPGEVGREGGRDQGEKGEGPGKRPKGGRGGTQQEGEAWRRQDSRGSRSEGDQCAAMTPTQISNPQTQEEVTQTKR